MTPLHIAVISAGRPHRVPAMREHLNGHAATWYVPTGQKADYLSAGAEHVVEVGALCSSRNAALADAWSRGKDCAQLSDDLHFLAWTTGKTRADVQPITLTAALTELRVAAHTVDAYLAGAMPTYNPFFAAPGSIQRRHFIVGDLMYIRYGTDLTFDPQLPLKEDYDYTLAHIAAHGRVARVGSLLASFSHRSNAGGAVAYRSPVLETEAITYLKRKWNNVIRDNPRRPHEILLKIPTDWRGEAQWVANLR